MTDGPQPAAGAANTPTLHLNFHGRIIEHHIYMNKSSLISGAPSSGQTDLD
jgi:hypothetical protein